MPVSGRHGDTDELGTARSDTVPTRPRHGPVWRGLAWLIEVRRLANRSEALANRSEGLANRSERLGAGLAWPVDKSEGRGPGWPGPVDKSEGLGGRAGRTCR